MTQERKLPTGRLGRLVRLVGVSARTGASLLVSGDAGAAAAAQAAEVLGTLRGLAAKVGQMASYVDGVVPETHRAAYETALRGLRAAAPTSSPAEIRRVVEEDLNAPIDKLFASWEEQPFASASIGQVHRATLEDGRRLAVKVQHPGIDHAIESDLENASVLQGLVATLGPSKLNSGAAFAEIKRRFREELDYTLEAERQRAFARIHEGDPGIRIPEVIGERSSQRVLSTTLASGISIEEAAEQSPELRTRYAETLWRFVFRGNLVGGMFNADPHPGNYLFQPDGSIVFLDFGCVQPLLPENQQRGRGMHLAALRGDEAEFRRCAALLLETRGGSFERAAVGYTRRCFAPLFSSPYHVTRDYVKSLVDGVVELKREIFAKDNSFVPLPEGILFLNRLQFGFYSVLARLDVPVDYAAVERGFLRAAGLYSD